MLHKKMGGTSTLWIIFSLEPFSSSYGNQPSKSQHDQKYKMPII
jgi:hypothetical protein